MSDSVPGAIGIADAARPAVGKRRRPMEVLCLGHGRTGSTSMIAALEKLGIAPIFHNDICIADREHSAMWADLIYAKKDAKEQGTPSRVFTTAEQWDEILGDYAALKDSPCNQFALELADAYPEAKVIVTVRDSTEAWFRSYSKSILEHELVLQTPTARLFAKLQQWVRPGGIQLIREAFWALDPPLEKFDEWGRAWYEDHNAALVEHVHPDRLLVFNVKEGWPKLCEFLGKPIPDTPFPHSNDMVAQAEGIKKRDRAEVLEVAGLVVKKTGLTAALCIGVGAFAWFWM